VGSARQWATLHRARSLTFCPSCFSRSSNEMSATVATATAATSARTANFMVNIVGEERVDDVTAATSISRGDRASWWVLQSQAPQEPWLCQTRLSEHKEDRPLSERLTFVNFSKLPAAAGPKNRSRPPGGICYVEPMSAVGWRS